MAVGHGQLWIADSVARELIEIDTQSGSVRRTVRLDLQPSAVAVADGAVWVSGYDSAAVEKIDPASGRAIGRVRVANRYSGDAVQIDARESRTRNSIDVGGSPTSLTVDVGRLWVGVDADARRHQTVRPPPAFHRARGPTELRPSPTAG